MPFQIAWMCNPELHAALERRGIQTCIFLTSYMLLLCSENASVRFSNDTHNVLMEKYFLVQKPFLELCTQNTSSEGSELRKHAYSNTCM